MRSSSWRMKRPQSPLLPKAALWLMNHRSEGYWWSSTKQTAMVIYGLIDYLKLTGELNSAVTATVLVNDRPVLTSKLQSDQPVLVLDESKLERRDEQHPRDGVGTGRVDYSARAEYWSSSDKLQKVGSGELNVEREYFRLVPNRDGEKIVYDTAPLMGPASAGDILAVKLTARDRSGDT